MQVELEETVGPHVHLPVDGSIHSLPPPPESVYVSPVPPEDVLSFEKVPEHEPKPAGMTIVAQHTGGLSRSRPIPPTSSLMEAMPPSVVIMGYSEADERAIHPVWPRGGSSDSLS